MDDFQLNLKRIREDDPTLTFLNLRDKNIGDSGAQALANALEKNKSLTELNLSNNQIGPSGAQALANALEKNNSLTNLNLSNNQIGSSGAEALAKALEKNSSLKELDLAYSEIPPKGAEALANALQKNKSLTKLNLWNNQIGSLGAEALAEALANNNSLTNLNLSNNKIGPSGAEALAKALQKNKSLTKFDLWTNEITDEGAKNIVLALKVNSTLIALNLNRNQQITKQYREKISDLIDENKNVSSISDKIFSNLQASQNLTFDDKELKLINTFPRVCEKILTQLLDKFKTKETKDGIEFKGNDFVERMKGFKVGLTILLNCKDSEVFKSLNNPLTVNDLFKGLGVMNNRVSRNNVFAEVLGGDGGQKILNNISAQEARSFRAEFSKENNSGSEQTPSSSPLNPSRLFSWITKLFSGR